jgi:glucosylceramidase
MSNAALKVSAYRNDDGSRVIEILNTATTTVRASLTVEDPGSPTAYVTDKTRSLSRTNAVSVHGDELSAQLAPRSLTTVVLDEAAARPAHPAVRR